MKKNATNADAFHKSGQVFQARIEKWQSNYVPTSASDYDNRVNQISVREEKKEKYPVVLRRAATSFEDHQFVLAEFETVLISFVHSGQIHANDSRVHISEV
jgi:hypothetical protein